MSEELKVYAVEVVRTSRGAFLVEASSYEAAVEEAEALVEEMVFNDFEVVDEEIEVRRTPETPKPGARVWRGGESGRWELWPEGVETP